MKLLRYLFCVFWIEKKESPSKQICICCLESLILCFKQFWDLYSMVAFSLTFFSIVWQAFASSRNYMRIFFNTFECFSYFFMLWRTLLWFGTFLKNIWFWYYLAVPMFFDHLIWHSIDLKPIWKHSQ